MDVIVREKNKVCGLGLYRRNTKKSRDDAWLPRAEQKEIELLATNGAVAVVTRAVGVERRGARLFVTQGT